MVKNIFWSKRFLGSSTKKGIEAKIELVSEFDFVQTEVFFSRSVFFTIWFKIKGRHIWNRAKNPSTFSNVNNNKYSAKRHFFKCKFSSDQTRWGALQNSPAYQLLFPEAKACWRWIVSINMSICTSSLISSCLVDLNCAEQTSTA